MTTLFRTFVAAVALFAVTVAANGADPRPPRTLNAAEMRLALQKLSVVGSALYVAAHPDDENTAMLAWLANERLVRTGYLSVTRGDGGQNLIGDEQGDLLGLIRTEELLAARRIDGAEQFFTRAVDFGFTKSSEETLRLWNRDAVLADVVWVIRNMRPDVIVTRFPTTGEGGHGQHTASAILANEAFTAAADPKRFPEQLKYVQPWQAKRIFWNAWRPDPNAPPLEGALTVELGGYNALLGRSYGEIAGVSRSMHRSQGFGVAERRGSMKNFYIQTGGDPAAGDLFEGIDLTWKRVPGGTEIAPEVERVRADFDPEHPEKSIPALLTLRKKIAALQSPLAAAKLDEIDEIIRSAAALWLEAVGSAPEVSAGETTTIRVAAVLRNPAAVSPTSLSFRDGEGREVAFTPKSIPTGALKLNEPSTGEVELTVPAGPTSPHWLEGRSNEERPRNMAEVKNPLLRTTAGSAAPLTALFSLDVAGTPLQYEIPVAYRSTDPVLGERYRIVAMAPQIVVDAPQTLLFPTAAKRQVSLTVEKETGGVWKGTIAPNAPHGWTITPASAPISMNGEGRQRVTFTIQPPDQTSSQPLHFSLTREGSETSRIAQTRAFADYEHIPPQLTFPITSVRLVRAEVKKAGEKIGYVRGSGDRIPDALQQIGYVVTELTDADLESGDLSGYDTIVLGVRALNNRDAAKKNVDRLFAWLENGGTLLVQYNTMGPTLAKNLSPFPLEVSRDRITDEEAAVTFTAPAHPLLNFPNKISAADFSGWVQERGVYFPAKTSEPWETVLAMHDPGESDLTTGIVSARYGKGTYVYTPLALFRQIPAGVPGAYRLLANLVSAGKSSR